MHCGQNAEFWNVELTAGLYKRYQPFKDEAQTALFKDPVRTAL